MRLTARLPLRQAGFTLIEVMIGLLIFAITVTLGFPAFRVWMQNTQIRTVAESIQNGIQLTRNEALKRNAQVQFILGPGTQWKVYVPSSAETIQTRSSADGSSSHQTATPTPAGATIVTFGGIGRVEPNADASPSLTQVDVDADFTIITAAQSKEMRIQIDTGGRIKMCAPYVTDNLDPRYCQP